MELGLEGLFHHLAQRLGEPLEVVDLVSAFGQERIHHRTPQNRDPSDLLVHLASKAKSFNRREGRVAVLIRPQDGLGYEVVRFPPLAVPRGIRRERECPVDSVDELVGSLQTLQLRVRDAKTDDIEIRRRQQHQTKRLEVSASQPTMQCQCPA